MKKNNFTLIELLVVISIIAILASILLPALAKARERGKTALCLGQQRQLSLSVLNYADESQGYMALCYGTQGYTTRSWLWMMEEAGALPNLSTSSPNQAYVCPCVITGKDKNWKQNYGYASGGYTEANITIFGQTGVRAEFVPVFKTHQSVRYATKTLMLGEASRVDSGGTFRRHGAIRYKRGSKVDYGVMSLNHLGSTNAVFLDGHGESLRYNGSGSEINQIYTAPLGSKGNRHVEEVITNDTHVFKSVK